ncbi:MAG: Peptidoglycan-binding lysin domain protein [bacterium]|nr:Peptidoglycan-binding lysin domain protein [bacterium]
MKRLLAIAAFAVCANARAQSASDLPSTPTTSSTQAGLPTTQTQAAPPASAGGARAYYPGMPLPEPPTGENPGPAAGGKTPARAGVDIYDSDFSGGFDSGGDSTSVSGGAPGEVPDTHVVQRGDTLWDLSARYYRNAWAWPKMWSYNAQITNPHWIYPGDVVRILPPGGGPAPAPAPKEASTLPTSRIVPRAKGPNGIFLRQTGFVEPGELAQAGKIIGSKEEKLMLGTLDEAYVEFKRDKPFQVGERYTIYKPTRAVKHPVSGKLLGHMVEIFGEGEVRAVTDGKIARVVLVDSLNPIERGFLVGPLKRQFKIVAPVADKSDMQGVVVATLQPRELIGAENIIFVDRGKNDGVEIGNRFLVTRRGDGYQPILAKGPMDDRRFPRETIAEVVVVDLRDHLATGFVTYSTVEARVGDRVEARRGF